MNGRFNGLTAVFLREFHGYFATPLAYVFIVIFLFTTGAFAFYIGNFFEAGQADLAVFFSFHPWLYLFFMPALAMRLWAEEEKTGTLEILMTLPMGLMSAVLGKFLAAWSFAGIALILTFPIWITVNVLGDPDNGIILASYIGSFLMAGGYLAIGACLSAATSNQVIAFVTGVFVSFLFTVSGSALVLEFASAVLPQTMASAIAGMSFSTHFQAIMSGVIDIRDLIFFVTLIASWLGINVILVDMKRVG
jgi:ABC-2 type transport system permease protein